MLARGFYLITCALLVSTSAFADVEFGTYGTSTATTDLNAVSSSKTTQVTGTFGFIANSYSNGVDQSLGTGFGFDGVLRHELSSGLYMNIDASALTSVGYSQIVYVNAAAPAASLMLNEASLEFQPVHLFKLRAGALNQSAYNDPIFLNSIAFPGAEETLKFDFDKFSLAFQSEQAIPTSSTTAPVETQTYGVPSFFLSRVEMSSRGRTGLLGSAHVGYFAFNNLPAEVAQESRLLGNTVSGLGVQGAQFAYNYAGYESGVNLRFVTAGSSLTPMVYGNWVNNLQVPASMGQGLLGGVGLGMQLTGDLTLTPRFELFELDSDSSPAFYNVTMYGHNNYAGESAVISLAFAKSKINVDARFSAGQLIDPSPFQTNFVLVGLNLSKGYDFF
jgi:hypothetical protein